MPMHIEGGVATLSDSCGPEDAADLADWLREEGGLVRIENVTHLHTALLQCLMAFEPKVEVLSVTGIVADAIAMVFPGSGRES